MPQLIIIRGLPGTGTFELVQTLCSKIARSTYWSEEMYFDKPEENIPNPRLYHPELARFASRWMHAAVEESLTSRTGAQDTVIVSGVFALKAEVDALRTIATAHGATCSVLETRDTGLVMTPDVPAAAMYDLRTLWETV